MRCTRRVWLGQKLQKSFDMVKVEYINVNNVKLELSMSQRWTKVTYKNDSRAEATSCHSKYSIVYFQKQEYNCYMQQILSYSKTYNNSNMEQ